MTSPIANGGVDAYDVDGATCAVQSIAVEKLKIQYSHGQRRYLPLRKQAAIEKSPAGMSAVADAGCTCTAPGYHRSPARWPVQLVVRRSDAAPAGAAGPRTRPLPRCPPGSPLRTPRATAAGSSAGASRGPGWSCARCSGCPAVVCSLWQLRWRSPGCPP